jgi:hypothetical protein
MIPQALSNPRQPARHEPLFDVDPRTGASIEVFYTDRSLETFGRCGPGWFWWSRRRRLFAEQFAYWARLLRATLRIDTR